LIPIAIGTFDITILTLIISTVIMAETNLVTRTYAQKENESSEKADMKNMSNITLLGD
jgi:hypothetical protein